MRVKELKKLLNTFQDSDIVIIAKDSEGNNFSPLCDIEEGKYLAKNSWSGDVGLRELTQELIDDGFREEDCFEDGENAIVLYPIN